MGKIWQVTFSFDQQCHTSLDKPGCYCMLGKIQIIVFKKGELMLQNGIKTHSQPKSPTGPRWEHEWLYQQGLIRAQCEKEKNTSTLISNVHLEGFYLDELLSPSFQKRFNQHSYDVFQISVLASVLLHVYKSLFLWCFLKDTPYTK